jgi:hypothetical protein
VFLICLQSIPSILLGEFLRKHLIIDLVCCTDDGMSWPLKVMKLHDPYKTILGDTWMELCQSNNLKGGDVIRFKFDSEFRCHVYKVGEY